MVFTPQPPEILFTRYSEALWHGNRNSNKIFLTFDDGPTPGVTDKLLNILTKKNIKANFFCIGKNAESHASLFRELIQEEHLVGNHTYHHLNLFRVGWKKYKEDIERCANVFSSAYFRPPYGRITRSALKKIKFMGFHPVMWDLITYDFSQNLSPSHCKQIIRKRLKNGSIVVFHDSVKASRNMFEALEFLITYAVCKNLHFALLNEC